MAEIGIIAMAEALKRNPWTTGSLVALCVVTWVITAIRPYDFQAWALEQIAPLLCISLIVWSSQYVRFSPAALAGLAVLFVLHAIGTHFTYSLTPYDEFAQRWLGFSIDEYFGWQRNHYDRFVHLAFGALVALPFFEFLRSYFRCSNRAAWFFSLHLIISSSAIYELLEWWAAVIFASEAGALYLGSQGDIWDAQWDIALAILGFSMVYLTCAGKAYFANREMIMLSRFKVN